ncbi:MAG: lysophospholipid acyltransferase family protein [Bacteroidia bacterium]|jgi:1-acyl-sn-glycerol-3-phosphate acyltransferase
MSQIKHVFKVALALWFGFWFVMGLLLLYPAFAITLSNPKWYSTAHKIRRVWAWWLFFWGGIRVKQIIEKPFNRHKPYVITPNHSSQLDIVTLTGKLKMDFNFMAKMELAKVPVFGIFFRTIDIAVDRKNVRHAAQAYQKALKQLGEGKSIVIYPEGTIPSHTPKLGRFKEGAFKLAIEKQVPVLPVTIIGNWKVLPEYGKRHFMPGSVIQYIHQPIPTKGMHINQIGELMDEVKKIMEAKLAEFGY